METPFFVLEIISQAFFSLSSSFYWNIVSLIAYELPWYTITPSIGYQALNDDYYNGSGNNRFENNAWMHGPVIGVAFRF